MPKLKYNCRKCPGYCCSYPVIVVTKRDAQLVAKHFGVSLKVADERFFNAEHGYKRIMKRQPDDHYGRICQFFDTEERQCTIYPARPAACHDYPGKECGYWDFLAFERAGQKDDDYVSITYHNED